MRSDRESDRTIQKLARAAMAAALASWLGCSWQPKPRPDFEVEVEVQADRGRPVAGAILRWGERVVGRTNPEGALGLRVQGAEGQRIALSVSCPDGFASPRKPLAVVLRSTIETRQRPRLRVRCPPTRRRVVVAVRASGGPGLPIVRLGTELGRTDAAGVAHLLLELPPGEQLELKLDTSARADLLPRSPSAVFEVGDEDAVFLFDEAFTRRPPPQRRVRRPAGPQRI